jgi:NADPH2:quinone reductase
VKRITNGHGADVVLDPVGLISQSLKCAAWCARLVTIGFASGNIEAIAMNHVLLKNVSIVGVHWGAYVKSDPAAIPRVWNELFSLIAKGLYRGTSYKPDGSDHRWFQGLEDIPRALRRLEKKNIWGKAVITIQPHRRESVL